MEKFRGGLGPIYSQSLKVPILERLHHPMGMNRSELRTGSPRAR
jgi:hypothetical protein